MNLKDTYNKIARAWHDQHKVDSWWVPATDKFISFLEPHSKVLDAGCGSGVKSHYLHEKGFAVTGIDFSEGMISVAKELVRGVQFHTLSFAEVGSLRCMFDGIFMQASLLHIPKSESGRTVSELSACLRGGGYFYIAVKEKKNDKPDEEIKIENDLGYEYKRFFSYYTLDEIKKLLVDSEHEIVYEDVTPSGNTNWIQVIGRKK